MPAPEPRPPLHPLLAIAFGILAVSTASIFIRYAQQDAPSLVIAAARLTFASLFLAPVALGRQREELAGLTRGQVGLGLLSGFFLALHFASWISSLEFTTVVSSVVFVTTTPLWVALLAPFTLRERLGRPALAGMGLALGGGLFIALTDAGSGGSGSNPLLGDLLAVGGALAAAAYVLIGRRLRGRDAARPMSLVAYIFVVYGMAALVLIAFMLAARQTPLGYPPMTYLWLVLLALIPQLLGHSTFNWALRYLSAAYVSITLLGEPIGSTILAYFLLHEVPSLPKLLGAALILGGIFIASRQEAS